jgi:hypothetical protein
MPLIVYGELPSLIRGLLWLMDWSVVRIPEHLLTTFRIRDPLILHIALEKLSAQIIEPDEDGFSPL